MYRQIGKHESLEGKTNHLLLRIFLLNWLPNTFMRFWNLFQGNKNWYKWQICSIIEDFLCNFRWFVLPSNDLWLPIWRYYMMLNKQIPVIVCHNSVSAPVHNLKSKWQPVRPSKSVKSRKLSFSAKTSWKIVQFTTMPMHRTILGSTRPVRVAQKNSFFPGHGMPPVAARFQKRTTPVFEYITWQVAVENVWERYTVIRYAVLSVE